jgi:hypothetical protein
MQHRATIEKIAEMASQSGRMMNQRLQGDPDNWRELFGLLAPPVSIVLPQRRHPSSPQRLTPLAQNYLFTTGLYLAIRLNS